MTAPHGTSRRYRRGCRCDACRPAASKYARLGRWRRREARDGASAPAELTHGYSGYTNHHCRCDVCIAGNRENQRNTRAKRYAARHLINGRLVAVNAKQHGSPHTYTNHGCRCEPCTEAWVEYAKARRSEA